MVINNDEERNAEVVCIRIEWSVMESRRTPVVIKYWLQDQPVSNAEIEVNVYRKIVCIISILTE